MVKEPRVYVIKPDAARDMRAGRNGKAKGGEKIIYASPTNADSDSNDYVRNHEEPSPLLVLISYLLGPFALLVTGEGRRSKAWVSVAIGSGIASALIIWRWRAIMALLEGRGIAVVPVILVSSLVILTGLTVWARALHIMGQRNILLPRLLPKWIKRTGPIGALGLVVPGLGLFIAGHPRRGSFAFWMVGTVVVSILVLSNAAYLWSTHRGAGAIAGDTLETVFIVAAAIGFLGIATWIVQALDGARLAEHRFARSEGARGDAVAFALLAAIVVFSVMFEPASVAESLDRFAVSTRHEGCRIIPLYMELAAIRLDPSQPVFTLRAAELCDDLGRHTDARIMREELYDRWRLCDDMLRSSGPIGRKNSLLVLGEGDAEPFLIEENAADSPVSPWDRVQAIYGTVSARLEGE